MSLFGTHMTAFAILGSSGHAFNFGIVTFGLMASSSAFVVPVLLLFLGTKLWAVGKKFGHITPVQIFRDPALAEAWLLEGTWTEETT